jgi:predicted metal-dependent TIM-barrel fold hydrolase
MQRGARYLSGIADQFNKAKENVATLTQDPGNDVKLKMYALFKQVMFRGQGRGVKWGIKVHLTKGINPGGGGAGGGQAPPPRFFLWGMNM